MAIQVNQMGGRLAQAPVSLEFELHGIQAIGSFVEYFNKQRRHEALDNLTPEVVYFGREKRVKKRREMFKQSTPRHPRKWDLGAYAY
jgi:transposase InsO family protein